MVAVGEFWGSMGEEEFHKSYMKAAHRKSHGGNQYRARAKFPDLGHGLTLGVLQYANITFHMGYSVEDVVRGVERSVSYWRTQGKEGATREDVFTNYAAVKWVVEGEEGLEGELDDSGDDDKGRVLLLLDGENKKGRQRLEGERGWWGVLHEGRTQTTKSSSDSLCLTLPHRHHPNPPRDT